MCMVRYCPLNQMARSNEMADFCTGLTGVAAAKRGWGVNEDEIRILAGEACNDP